MVTPILCCTCEQDQGTCLCTGCNNYFCGIDFKRHRDTLFNEMNVLLGDHNGLQEKINKGCQQKDSCSALFAQIDEWQKKTMENVKLAAELARQQIKSILISRRVEITSRFDTLSKELNRRNETKDFAEQDLARLRHKIYKLNEDLKVWTQPPVIELHTEQSDRIVWTRLIRIEEKSTYSDNTSESGDSRSKYSSPLGSVGQYMNDF
jgi:chromosome segregation ATPase